MELLILTIKLVLFYAYLFLVMFASFYVALYLIEYVINLVAAVDAAGGWKLALKQPLGVLAQAWRNTKVFARRSALSAL